MGWPSGRAGSAAGLHDGLGDDSSMATAGGTLVLAVAKFSSIKTSARAARLAERSLLVGLRPVLVPSREDVRPSWCGSAMARS